MHTLTQHQKAETFKTLHTRNGIFVIPNPWDAGSARMLASLGFEALATTSAGLAYSLAKPDGEGVVTLEEALTNCSAITSAVTLPVSVDLENGYSDDPEGCAKAILLAAKAGVVGGSVEDATGKANAPIYPFELALERVRAAVMAAKSLDFPFLLTARAENLIHGVMDLSDTIKRLEAYAEAGADVLFAPGLKSAEDIAAVVKALAPKPVNVVMGLSGVSFSLNQLEDLGVKRVSLGSSLARAAYGAFINAAKEIKSTGTFDFANGIIPYGDVNRLLR